MKDLERSTDLDEKAEVFSVRDGESGKTLVNDHDPEKPESSFLDSRSSKIPLSEFEKTSTTPEPLTPRSITQPTFPNGGLTAWLNVCGSVLVCFCSLGFLQSFGVFQDYYGRHILSECSPSQISWIGSTQLFLAFFITPLSGKFLDDGYFNEMLLGSSILLVVCTFLLSLAQPQQYYQIFLSQGIGQGLAMGLMFLPSVSILAQYFSVRRTLIMSLGSTGASIAGTVLPVILNQFFNGKAGFVWGVRYLGFIALGMLITANVIMKPRIKTKRRPSREENIIMLKKFMTDVPYIIALIGFVLLFWTLYVPYFYLQLFAVLHGIDETLAFHSITIMNAASLLGRIIPNLIVEHVGTINSVVIASLLSGALMFAMFAAKTVPGLIAFAVLYGFFSGKTLALAWSGITSFADDVNEVGVRIGVCMCAASFALLTGNPIVGALLRAPEYRWEKSIIFCGVVMLAGSSFVLIARMLLVKKRGTWKI